MKVISGGTKHTILRFDPGEDVIEVFTDYIKREHIAGATFAAIGAADEVTVAFFDREAKEYLDEEINEDLEIVSVQGNVSWYVGKAVVHGHGIFSNRKGKVYAGHVKRMRVSVTCELWLTILDQPLERTLDKTSGLPLLAARQKR